jgi:hypothetical protein
MSEELKIKVGVDVSDAEKAAQALPDAFEKISIRQSRDFQMPSGGVIDLGRQQAILPQSTSETSSGSKSSNEEREAEKIRKQEQKHSDEMLRLKFAEYNKKKRLAEQESKDAEDWANTFTKQLTNGFLQTLAPLALFGKGVSILADLITKGATTQAAVTASVSVGGFNSSEVKMARVLAGNLGSTMTRDEGQQFMEEAMTKARNYAKGVSVEGALGLEAFGMGRSQREEVLSGTASYIEMLARMSDEYERTGNTAQYAFKMQSIFGDKWEKLRPQLAAGRRVLTTDLLGSTMKSIGDIFNDKVNVESQRFLHGQGAIKNWMGGSEGGGLQTFAMASSLQAMGGGDVLSAINRGPMEEVASNTERTAGAVESINNKMEKQAVDTRSPVAILGY